MGALEEYKLLIALVLTIPRLLTVLWILPFLPETILPRSLRIAFAVSLGLILLPLVYSDYPSYEFRLFDAAVIAAKEVFIGLLISFLVSMPFWIASGIGYLIDSQRGALLGMFFSPFYNSQVSSMGVLLVQIMGILFMVSGSFLLMIKSLYFSYLSWPVFAFYPALNPSAVVLFVDKLAGYAYELLRLASPIVIILFAIDLVMGLINRFVPQLNVFFLSMPIKGLVSILVIAIYIPNLTLSFDGLLNKSPEAFNELERVLQ